MSKDAEKNEGASATVTAVAPVAKSNTAVAQADQSDLFFRADLASLKEFPDLEAYAVANLELASEYMSAENLAEGEFFRILFARIEVQERPNMNDPSKMEEVPTVFFYAKNNDGDYVLYQNSSKKFVSSITNFGALPGMGFVVAYKGKVTFKNGKKGDDWSVRPIMKEMEKPKKG